ncbi:hypothetical protein HNP90_001878 [Methanococcus maripaludis]|uniref:Uncharacterized protein n=1 Tax=Methanococcus maripaludis TaxID=39152 RepID=A0A7J9PNA2_METMI|nr:hypothetical protein [Methanococcus maripaludis]
MKIFVYCSEYGANNIISKKWNIWKNMAIKLKFSLKTVF